MRRAWLILALLIGLGSGTLARAQPPPPNPDLYPDQSVGVLSEDPGYGERWSTEIFPFGNYVGPTTGRDVFCRTYLRFPISPGSPVVRAVLSVYVDDYWPAPGGAPMSVYPVAADWAPPGVDWYDMAAWPALGTPVATTEVTSAGGWFSWDVTGLVREWASGARPNYGLALAAADLDSTAANWAAARRLTAGDPATRPYLALTFEVPTTATAVPPTPAPAETPSPAPPPTPPPTPVPALLPETGGTSAIAGYLLGAGLALWLLAALGNRRRGRPRMGHESTNDGAIRAFVKHSWTARPAKQNQGK